MIGNPGTGKTHLMTSLDLKACRLGYKVLFKTAAILASELSEAHDNYQLVKWKRPLPVQTFFSLMNLVMPASPRRNPNCFLR